MDRHDCIFHVPKEDENPALRAKMAVEFVAELDTLVKAQPEGQLDLRGFDFPETWHWDVSHPILQRDIDLTKAIFRGFCSLLAPGAVQPINGRLKFAWASFRRGVSILNIRFTAPLSLEGASFDEQVTVSSCEFLGGLTASGAQFGGEVRLQGCEVASLNVIAAKFMETATLNRVMGTVQLLLRDAEFVKGLEVEACETPLLDLSGAHLGGRVRFVRSDVSVAFLLKNLWLDSGSLVELRDCNLRRASFLGTNVESFVFSDTTWGRRGPLRRRRLLDEDKVGLGVSYEAVAENYRQLVLSHEKRRDYDAAEDFHEGEMEMRRRSSLYFDFIPGFATLRRRQGRRPGRWFRMVRSIEEHTNEYAAYGLLSRYGTSFLRAGVILAALVAAIAVQFLFVGLGPTATSGDPTEVMEYNLLPDARHTPASAGQVVSDFGRALLFTSAVATFQRERYFHPLDTRGEVLVVLTSVLIPAQAALFLLAIRRRFRR